LTCKFISLGDAPDALVASAPSAWFSILPRIGGSALKEHQLMTRSILCGLLALVSVGALGLVPIACQSGGVGDPCTPEDEYTSTFSGFNVDEENIESRSFQCATRICLVNHFQGRVSCPQGQDATQLVQCKGLTDGEKVGTTCGANKACAQSEVFSPTCSVCPANDTTCVAIACPNGLTCDGANQICTCTQDTSIGGIDYHCIPSDSNNPTTSPQVLVSFLCHTPGECQTIAGGTTAANSGKDCCIPGTDSPVSASVCGQCNVDSKRDANDAVYCTVRCCVPCCAAGVVPDPNTPLCSTDTSICGPACDPDFNYQDCPSGYQCTGIRTNVGIADPQLTGAYCIKSGSAFSTDATCGNVVGYVDPTTCKGVGTSAPTAGDGG